MASCYAKPSHKSNGGIFHQPRLCPCAAEKQGGAHGAGSGRPCKRLRIEMMEVNTKENVATPRTRRMRKHAMNVAIAPQVEGRLKRKTTTKRKEVASKDTARHEKMPGPEYNQQWQWISTNLMKPQRWNLASQEGTCKTNSQVLKSCSKSFVTFGAKDKFDFAKKPWICRRDRMLGLLFPE